MRRIVVGLVWGIVIGCGVVPPSSPSAWAQGTPAREPRRWALLVDGRWVENFDTLADAKAAVA